MKAGTVALDYVGEYVSSAELSARRRRREQQSTGASAVNYAIVRALTNPHPGDSRSHRTPPNAVPRRRRSQTLREHLGARTIVTNIDPTWVSNGGRFAARDGGRVVTRSLWLEDEAGRRVAL